MSYFLAVRVEVVSGCVALHPAAIALAVRRQVGN